MGQAAPLPPAACRGDARVALVCFEHRPGMGVLRLLRPGFRHCFCLLQEAGAWLVCDPLKRGLTLELLPDWPAGELARHYAATGRHVALGRASRNAAQPAAPLHLLTCVEVVKRAIGVEARGVLTPWRLFRRLVDVEGWRSHSPAGAKALDGDRI